MGGTMRTCGWALLSCVVVGCGQQSAPPGPPPPSGPPGRVVLDMPKRIEVDRKKGGAVIVKITREDFEGDVTLEFDTSAAPGIGFEPSYIESGKTETKVAIILSGN